MFLLVVESGPHAGEQHVMKADSTVLGRAREATWCLPNDPALSRNHLQLRVSGDAVSITDLGSTGGTLLNGAKVTPNAVVWMRPGDRLQVGQSTIRLDANTRAAAVAPPPVMSRPSDRNACITCGEPFARFGGKARSNEFTGLCNGCAKQTKARIDQFKWALKGDFDMWSGSPADLVERIEHRARLLGLSPQLALSGSADVSLAFLQRVLTFLVQDGHLDADEERVFYQYRDAVQLSQSLSKSLHDQIAHYTFMRDLHAGKLPSVRPSAMLPAGEIAHLEVPAVYTRELARSVRYHQGLFLVTNSRVIFTQTDMPFEVALSKVLGINLYGQKQFQLQLAKRQGTGAYQSDYSFYAVEVLRSALEFHLRHRVLQQSGSRSIAPDVRSAVWSRDGGKCVQCGDSLYLEFDHIIPFSKGGASSTNNLQLLCRGCNLSKSNKL